MEENRELLPASGDDSAQDTPPGGGIEDIDISKEMQDSFLDYSMSVIVSRALPDVRDGMKPVHRRILYSMSTLNMSYNTAHKKSARIVGDVIGKYHPHGDTAVYDAMVRMAQDFSYRYPLVDGHGNFGSLDGDGAAAMRYTEARMARISSEMVADINKETVDLMETYDGEGSEPVILPSRVPNLLLNGSTGIAVGMATNIPTHNFAEIVAGIKAVIANPQISTSDLMEFIPGPDFPTGGIIMGRSGIKNTYETGKGTIVVRARYKIENFDNGRKRIVFYEIPYQVNKLSLFQKMASLASSKQIDGISRINDESNRNGIRLVVELKRNAQEDVILNQLFRLTPLQSNYSANMLALQQGRPKQLSLREIIQAYIDHQTEVIERRSAFDLKKAQDRLHIVKGLRIALDHLDELITMIRNSHDPEEVLVGQMNEAFGLDETQSKAILALQIRRLSGLERGKIEDEFNQLLATIADLQDILSNNQRVLNIIETDLDAMEQKYGDARRTEIVPDYMEALDEDLIKKQDILVTLTESGYVKAQPLDMYHTQNKGGKGVKSTNLYEEDSVDRMIAMSSHDYILLFTNMGRVYRLRGYDFQISTRQSKGVPIINLLPLQENEKVKALLPYKKEDNVKDLLFVTEQGIIKKTPVHEFVNINKKGKMAISLNEGDSLAFIVGTSGDDEIFIAGSKGRAIHIHESELREYGRTAAGVKGMNLEGGTVVGISLLSDGDKALIVSENGLGKRIDLTEIRQTKRGSKGVQILKVSPESGEVVGFRALKGDEDALISTKNGKIIRVDTNDIRPLSRYARGAKLIRLDEGDQVKRLALTPASSDEVVQEEEHA